MYECINKWINGIVHLFDNDGMKDRKTKKLKVEKKSKKKDDSEEWKLDVNKKKLQILMYK